MIVHIHAGNVEDYGVPMDGMFRDRKRVFVDKMGWDLRVDGDHERDDYDDGHAEYIVVIDPEAGMHRGSMRLLRTDRPHLLSDIFPVLCSGPIPRGPEYRELTRLCPSPDLAPAERRNMRNLLFTAVVAHALDAGIVGYTGVAEAVWLDRLLQLGWQCSTLGPTQLYKEEAVGAFLADITPETLNLFRRAGTYVPEGERIFRS